MACGINKPATCFCKYIFIAIKLGSFVCILSVAIFIPYWQSWVVLYAQSLAVCPFAENVGQLLV